MLFIWRHATSSWHGNVIKWRHLQNLWKFCTIHQLDLWPYSCYRNDLGIVLYIFKDEDFENFWIFALRLSSTLQYSAAGRRLCHYLLNDIILSGRTDRDPCQKRSLQPINLVLGSYCTDARNDQKELHWQHGEQENAFSGMRLHQTLYSRLTSRRYFEESWSSSRASCQCENRYWRRIKARWLKEARIDIYGYNTVVD